MKKIVIVIIGIAILGLGVLFLFQDSDTNSNKTSKTPKAQQNTGIYSPEEVIEQYTNATLGTLPSAFIDYELAKTHLDNNLRKQFTDDSFVPRSYGIQQGPNNVSIELVFSKEDEAKVLVEAYYGGEMELAWLFTLTNVSGEWKISTIEEYQP